MTKPPRKPSKPLLGDADALLHSRPHRRRDPNQPNLPLDPMPDRIEPCLALLKARPPKGDDWVYEIKWDGYRLSVHIDPTGIRILTRDGHDLVPAGGQRDIRLSEEIETDGDQLLASACEHGLEGIIAKRRDSPYRSGRLGDWVKIKRVLSDSFVIVGCKRSTVARAGIGRLLLAARKGMKLVYVGGVGTGFNERNAYELRQKLDRLITSTPAAVVDRKGAIFVKPKLIAEIEYRGWADDGKLRHASHKGLREEQDNAGVSEIE
ncbi:DNA ligase [Rhizobium leguminosarum]|uniref:ATP dependent DNA ligase n=1 Tax=Rhizobium leguminosarum TaxID=384 RepID=UPI0003705E29|nr:ATP-dependent DNA ligase [Rhizobium leguminosarum]MBY3030248.1 DNA ligase [Rhizobium leguminosarum]